MHDDEIRDENRLGIKSVFIIYSADVISETSHFINRMSPAEHISAGFNGDKKAEREAIAAKFTQTENDGQYEFGYLADEHTPRRVSYYPYGYTDREGTEQPSECRACDGMGEISDDYRMTPCDKCDGRGEQESGQGQHRKWVAELTYAEWLLFADAYIIDLDANGIPERYEETLGSITSEGTIPAISVDNTEGWHDHSETHVINSTMYVSFAMREK